MDSGTPSEGSAPAPPRRPIARNALAVSVSGAAIHGLNFALGVLAARLLGLSDFGLYSYGSTLALLLTALSDLGLTIYTVKSVSQNSTLSSAFARRIVFVRALSCAVFFGAAASVMALRGSNSQALSFVSLLGLSGAIGSYVVVAGAWWRGLQQMSREGILRTLAVAVPLIASAGALAAGWGIVGLALGQLAGTVLVAAGLGFLGAPWKAQAAASGGGTLESGRETLRKALPFAILTILVTISYRIDSVLLEQFRGDREVGVYAAAYRVLEFGIIVRGVLPAVLLPTFSQAFGRGDKSAVVAILNRLLKYHVIGGILTAFALHLAAPWIVHVMYGPSEYAGAIEPLRILAFAAVAVWVSSITSVVVSAGPDPGINTRIAFVMAASNIAMNILILPKFGASGAAATTVATEFLGLALISLYIWRRVLPLPYGALFWGGLVCVAVGLGGRWIFPSPWLAPLALAAFLALAVVTRSLTIADLRDLVTTFSGSRLRNPGTSATKL